jgi:2-oxo-4-hydroxy-4-carboxy-5-ureidoimidazoline decarboxylase
VIVLAELNALDRDAFTGVLTHIFERSPWVPRRAWAARPFATVAELHEEMVGVVEGAEREEQLALIRAHPELLGRLAPAAALTAESRREQAGAGLQSAGAAELEALGALNARYREKFGFPFIVAVRGMDLAQIVARLGERLGHTPQEEFAQCLVQIARIARLRLEETVGD